MKNRYLLLLLLLLTPRAWADGGPSFPKDGKTLSDFIPKGWHVLKQAEGDLNQDSLNDALLALGSDNENTPEGEYAENNRHLLVLLKKSDGGYHLAVTNNNIILCKGCGGVFGDPFNTLAVERGAIVIGNYGGSSERWGTTYRFRYQNNDWYLIGETDVTEKIPEGTQSQTDINFSTNMVEITHTNSQGVSTVTRSKQAAKPLAKLVDFDPAH